MLLKFTRYATDLPLLIDKGRSSSRLLLMGLHRVPPINLLHDPLCPADSIRYGSYGSRNPRCGAGCPSE